MKYVRLTLVGMALSACVSIDGEIRAGLDYLEGKSLFVAIAHLGYPNDQVKIAGSDVYIWSTEWSGNMTLPAVSTTTGNVGRSL